MSKIWGFFEGGFGAIVGRIIYSIAQLMFGLIDMVQDVFFGLAGIGNVYFNGIQIGSNNTGMESDTGILYFFLTSATIKNLFFSILILALFLLVIFTAMAFIKNTYVAKPKVWTEIVSSAVKGLANFIFIPICCLLGVWLGNILLKAINAATSNGNSTLMSRKLFIASAYNANRLRMSDSSYYAASDDGEIVVDLYADEITTSSMYNKISSYLSKYNIPIKVREGQSLSYYADIVDQMFSYTDENNSAKMSLKTEVVEEFYSLDTADFNFVVLIVGGVFMMYVLYALSFGMVRRLYILLSLFVISPALCSLYPLDDGKAVGSWKGEFIKQTISAYGAVAGMNIFFSVLPLVENIKLYKDTIRTTVANDVFQLFLIVSGLFCVKEIISMISGYIGADDAYSKGAGLASSTTKAINQRLVKPAGALATGTIGAFSRARATRKAGGSFAKSLAGSVGSGLAGLGKKGLKFASGGVVDLDAMGKAAKEQKELGEKSVLEKRKADNIAYLKKYAKNKSNTNEEVMKKAKSLGMLDEWFEYAAKDENAKRIRAGNKKGNKGEPVMLTSKDQLKEQYTAADDLMKIFQKALPQIIDIRNEAAKNLNDEIKSSTGYKAALSDLDGFSPDKIEAQLKSGTEIVLTDKQREDATDAQLTAVDNLNLLIKKFNDANDSYISKLQETIPLFDKVGKSSGTVSGMENEFINTANNNMIDTLRSLKTEIADSAKKINFNANSTSTYGTELKLQGNLQDIILKAVGIMDNTQAGVKTAIKWHEGEAKQQHKVGNSPKK